MSRYEYINHLMCRVLVPLQGGGEAQIGQIIKFEDGVWRFIPDEPFINFEARNLRDIAGMLDELNTTG